MGVVALRMGMHQSGFTIDINESLPTSTVGQWQSAFASPIFRRQRRLKIAIRVDTEWHQRSQPFFNVLDSVLENPNSCELRTINIRPYVHDRIGIGDSRSYFQGLWCRSLPLLDRNPEDRFGEGFSYVITGLFFIRGEAMNRQAPATFGQ